MYPIGLLAQAQDLQPRRGILFLGHILIDRDQDLRATVGHPHQCGGAIEPAVLAESTHTHGLGPTGNAWRGRDANTREPSCRIRFWTARRRKDTVKTSLEHHQMGGNA